MLLYYFVNEKYGLEDLKESRLKISIISQLNDPFEHLAVNLRDPVIRKAFLTSKASISKKYGLLCLSMNWKSPLQWTHYADRHRGFCLCFEIPDNSTHFFPVEYVPNRQTLTKKDINEENVKQLLKRKFDQWQYEEEIRSYVVLDKPDQVTGHYYFYFHEGFKLKKVFIGSESNVTKKILDLVLTNHSDVTTIKVRPAFQTFSVVVQLNSKMKYRPWSRP